MSKDQPLKKNLNIWSDVLKEENLCETLNKIDFVKNSEEDTSLNKRGIESYDYVNENLNDYFEPKTSGCTFKNKNRLNKKNKHFKNKPCSIPDQSILNGEVFNNLAVNKEIKDRLGPVIFYDETKPRDHIAASEFDSDEKVAKEIAKHLKEPKIELISNYNLFFFNFNPTQ